MPKDDVVPGNPVARDYGFWILDFGFWIDHRPDLRRQFRRAALVGVDEKDPGAGGHVQGGVTLIGKVAPGALLHADAGPASQLHRGVRAVAVQHQTLVGPGQGVQAGDDVFFLIAGQYYTADCWYKR